MKDEKRITELFNKAVQLHQSSKFDEASKLYAEILSTHPKHFEALQLLATLMATKGQLVDSVDLFSKAIEISDKNTKVLNNYGYVLAQLGDLDKAQRMYERAIKIDVNYLDALNNLANLFQQLGDYNRSIGLYERVIKLNNTYVQAHFNKGVALQKLAKYADAISSYDAAIRIKQDYLDAYLNKATALKEMRSFEEALIIYRHLLSFITGPIAFDVHNNCGNLLQETGQLQEALNHFDQAVMVNPYQAITYSNRANVLQRLGKFQEAILSYGVAIAIDGTNSDFYNNRGNALQNCAHLDLEVVSDSHSTQNLDHALSDYEYAITLRPDQAQAYYNRGNLYKYLKNNTAAINSYLIALRLEPTYADVYNNLGNIYKDLNSFELAKVAYDQSIRFNPHNHDAYNNKGVTLQRELKLEAANECFESAIRINPNLPKSYVNKAIIAFLQGKWLDAWSLYEYRLGDKELIPSPLQTSKPRLQPTSAQDLSRVRLLIWSEQGVGDAVMFACMFTLLQTRVGELLVTLDSRLMLLFQRSFPKISFLDKNSVIDPSVYDVHLPMGSIGFLLQLQEPDIKVLNVSGSYLRANPMYCSDLRLELDELKTGVDSKPNQVNQGLKYHLDHNSDRNLNSNTKPILCGISWQSTNPTNGADRSIDPRLLIESLRMEGVQFVNLQYTPPTSVTQLSAQSLQIERNLNISDLKKLGLITTGVNNFEEIDKLAALISNCDLVISIDNSTVHLSAALGIPTWVLLPVMPDWRWMLERNDSPWYPSVQLFRQKDWGDWVHPLKEIKRKLRELVLENI